MKASDIQVYDEKPYLQIGSERYPVHQKEALMFKYLQKRYNIPVSSQLIAVHCECSFRSLRVYATTLRSILNPYGLHVKAVTRHHEGYYQLTDEPNTHDHRSDQ